MKLWDTGTWKDLVTHKQNSIDLIGHSRPVNTVTFSPDGKTLASASEDGTVKLWDTSTWKELATLKGQSRPVKAIAFSADGGLLASLSDAKVHLWIAATKKEVAAATTSKQ